jgi:hypothetical protein
MGRAFCKARSSPRTCEINSSIVWAILGLGVLYLAIASLNHSLPAWSTITPSKNTPSVILDVYVQHIDTFHAAWSGAIFLVGWLLLVWPARERKLETVSAAPQPTNAKVEEGKPN